MNQNWIPPVAIWLGILLNASSEQTLKFEIAMVRFITKAVFDLIPKFILMSMSWVASFVYPEEGQVLDWCKLSADDFFRTIGCIKHLFYLMIGKKEEAAIYFNTLLQAQLSLSGTRNLMMTVRQGLQARFLR